MSRLQANLLLLVAAAIWGSTFVVQQVSMEVIGPNLFTAARFFLGALVLVPLAYGQWKRHRNRGNDLAWQDWAAMCGLGLILYLGVIIQQVGIKYTTVTNASFLTALYVPLVPVLALILWRRPPHWVIWPSATGCLVGTYFLSGGDLAALNMGDVWVIGSALFWALHVLFIGRVVSKTQQPVLLATVQFAICAILATAAAFILESPDLTSLELAMDGILYAGLVSVGVGFTLQVVAQRHTPPADTAILLSMEAVFAAAAGAWFLGERLPALGLAGAGLILASVLAAELLPLMRKKRRLHRA